MKIVASAYENGDHACLIWFPADFQPIAGCRGFAIERTTNGTKKEYVRNFTGFSDTDTAPPAGQEWKWPIQRYLWWDYFVKVGDKVSYRVIPVTGSAASGSLQLDMASASAPTTQILISGQVSPHMSAYFNKGIIATQWVTRELQQEAGKAPPRTKLLEIITKPGNPLRDALSGLARIELLDTLQTALKNGSTIYAALYELNDPELVGMLTKFKKRANVILANGAFNPKKPDENKAVRAKLKKVINVKNRMVSSGHFAHNKFLVVCDKTGKNASTVLTGSTNWTVTGLCTQANNALIINDPKIAQAYRDEWDRIAAAGNVFPPALKTANSQKKSFALDNSNVTVWFVPTTAQQDMIDARAKIAAAQDGVLFLFFNPGTLQQNKANWTLLQAIDNLDASKLYIRGVVNQTIKGLTEGQEAPTKGAQHPVSVVTGGNKEHLTKDVLVPAAIKEKYGHWEKELLSVGVMVHSKVVVIDPFGKHPVLITGSHNLGPKASRANDDNMVIVEGPGARGLAISYAVNIIAIYQEYRWRSYVAQHQTDQTAFRHLQDDDQWQQGHLTNERGEMEFWMGKASATKA